MFKVNPYRPGAGLMPTYLNENLNSSCGLSQKICGIKFHFAP